MTRLNGKRIYELLDGVDDAFIEDADISARLPAKGTKQEREPSAFRRWLNTPAAAAIISGVVAFTVLFLIVRAGHNAPVGPDPAGRGTQSAAGTTVTEPVTEPVTEAATESETEAVTEARDLPFIVGDKPDNPLPQLEDPIVVLALLMVVGVAAVMLVTFCRAGRRGGVTVRLPGADAPDAPTLAQKILLTVFAALFVLCTPYLVNIQFNTARFIEYRLIYAETSPGTYTLVTKPGVQRLAVLALFLPSILACIAGAVLAVICAVRAWRKRLTAAGTMHLAGMAGVCAWFVSAWLTVTTYDIYSGIGTPTNQGFLLASYNYWCHWRLFGIIGPKDGINITFMTEYMLFTFMPTCMLTLLILLAAAVLLIPFFKGRQFVPTPVDSRRASGLLCALNAVCAAVVGAASLSCIVDSLRMTPDTVSVADPGTDIRHALMMLLCTAVPLILSAVMYARVRRNRLPCVAGIVLTAVSLGVQLFFMAWLADLDFSTFEFDMMFRVIYNNDVLMFPYLRKVCPILIAATTARLILFVRERPWE